MARLSKEEFSSSNGHAVQLISVVDELNPLSSQEFSRLLKESDNFTIHFHTRTGSSMQIDLERLASVLPLHLIATMLSCNQGQISTTLFGEESLLLAYFLRGFRLLHSLADLASRNTRFEQILLEDIRLSEQMLDLVFYVLVVLACYKQDNKSGVSTYLLHSALVASSFHLLTSCITSQWQDLVDVLLAHPKVDIFMDGSFDSVRVDIKFLHVILSPSNSDVLNAKTSQSSAERTINCICQHCEGSVQFILSLCQQKSFRDRILKNKELCKNGGILSLVQVILDLKISGSFNESFEIVASVSRLKSKVLSILLQLCEAENISYLDEVAGSPRTMDLAKSVVLKILDLLKDALSKETTELTNSFGRRKPKGLVLLNSMRLADIFSDDSNFRSFLMANITWILAEILAMPSEEFLASWCCIDIPIVEEDAVLEYDPRVASGVVLGWLTPHQDDTTFGYPGLSSFPQASYAQHRTSYLVKIIANLHCFVPTICEEQEKDLFLNKFYECLVIEPPKFPSYPTTSSHKASVICKNLSSLSIYARSLIPDFLNDDDVDLLSVFLKQLEERSKDDSFQKIFQEHSFHHVPDTYKDPQSVESVSNFPSDAPLEEKKPDSEDCIGQDGVSKNSIEYQIVHSSGMQQTRLPGTMDMEPKEGDSTNLSPSTSLKDENREVANLEVGAKDICSKRQPTDAVVDAEELLPLGENIKESESFKAHQDDKKADPLPGEEKQPRKRKRNIMNDRQITLIENALIDEPDMHRNSTLLQSWADKLSLLGSELTPSQLKNWLNNRKARLARAAREARAPSEGENMYPDKSYGSSISHYYDSPESGGEESYASVNRAINSQNISKHSGSAEKVESVDVNATDVILQQGTQKSSARSVQLHLGQRVNILDIDGRVIGKGNVSLLEGHWHGNTLDSNTCIISVEELYIDRSTSVRHPSEAAGTTFAEAEAINKGAMMVAWDVGMLSVMPR